MRDNFVIMKVNYSEENKNLEFLNQFPKVAAFPHYFVLDSNGEFLHSQGTGELEEDPSYDEKVFAEFLDEWKPKLADSDSAK